MNYIRMSSVMVLFLCVLGCNSVNQNAMVLSLNDTLDTVLGYQLELINLLPYPQTNKTILPKDYSAKILVSK